MLESGNMTEHIEVTHMRILRRGRFGPAVELTFKRLCSLSESPLSEFNRFLLFDDSAILSRSVSGIACKRRGPVIWQRHPFGNETNMLV